MCGSVEFCAGCKPDDFMVAWMQGKHHVTPEFGDGAQWALAHSRRKSTFKLVLALDKAAALKFPEFLQQDCYWGRVQQLASTLTAKNFETLLEKMPAFARYVAQNRRAFQSNYHGRKQRAVRKRAYRMWRRGWISGFVLRHGGVGALRQIYELIPHLVVPQWLTELEPVLAPTLAMAA